MGNGSPWSAPGQAELVDRVQATEADALRTTARVLGRVAGEYDRVAGEMNGVRAAASNYWQADSQKAFNSYATTLTGDLSDAAAAMRAMADALVSHASATEAAQGRLHAAAGLATAGKYAPNQTADDGTEQRWALQATHDFHASEISVRAKLWQLGTDAPGGIPLPSRPPEPRLNWWQSLLSQSPYGPQFWVDSRGLPRAGNPHAFDPRHPLFGFDEDGHKVPAFMADPMAQLQMQDGIPIAPLLRLLRLNTGEFESIDEAEIALARSVRSATAFRPSHINQHIRDYYGLPGKGLSSEIPESMKPPVPEWAKTSFARVVAKASMSSNRVFEFRTGTAMTNAVLYEDQETKQFILVMFHRSGKFATAYAPSANKLKAALEAKTLVVN